MTSLINRKLRNLKLVSLTTALLTLLAIVALAVPQHALAASSAVDTFARANGGLGSSWTATSDGGLSIVSDLAVGAASGNAGDLWSASSFTSDQYAEVELSSVQLSATQWVGPMVRGQASGQSGYVAIYFWNNGSPEIMLFARKGGGWSQLGSSYAVSPLGSGAVLGLQAAGSALSVVLNGTVVISASDGSFTGGSPGLMTNAAAHAAGWAGGSGAVPSSSPFGSGGSGGSGGGSQTYTVGGSVSGLSSGSVVLQDNGGDSLSVAANGSFTFATALASGAAYNVTVASSPSGLACSAGNASGTVGSANVTTVTVTCQASTSGPSSAVDTFARANGGLGSSWTATSDGGLSIVSDLAVGAASGNAGDLWSASSFTSDQYAEVELSSVQLSATQWVGPMVRGQASGQSGYVAIYFWNNGSPEIMLFARKGGGWSQLGSSYAVSPLGSGAVLGLQAAGSALSVVLNGTVVISASDGSFTGGSPGLMTNAAAHAAGWAGGSGAVPSSSPFGSGGSGGSGGGSQTYTVGGSVSGLSSGSVVLQDNGGDSLSVAANGSFTFATALASGAAYNVTVASSPSGLACSAGNASGTVGSANVTTVTVTCQASPSGPSSAVDTFARANGGLGSSWTATSDGGLSIVSDLAVGAASGNAGDLWSASSFTSDQYAEVELSSVQLSATQWVGPMVRGQASGQSGYVAIYFWNNGSPEIMLFARKGGGWSQLGSSYAVSPLGSGAVLGLQAAGSALSVVLNGTVVISASDGSFTGGSPGLMTNAAAHAAGWAGGSGAVPSSSPFGSGGSGGSGGGSQTYTVGGSVSGLSSGSVVLQDNGGDSLSVAANGSFTFATALASGAAYNVTVASSPSGLACSAGNASGTVGSANVTTVTVTCQAIPPLTVSYVSTDANGIATYNMTSPIVSDGATEPLRVLNPTNPAPGVAHNFLIALPVEPGEGSTYGDAMSTLESLNAQNQYNLTIIEPSFSIDPWYADSASDPTMLMETFMTDQLVPWIKANLATSGKEQVWLIGFSKSGVGAQDLILKHPGVYSLAASWDFPDSTSYNALGASEATGYGTNANFVANYELSQSFVDTYAAPFTAHKRLWIGGYYYFDWDVYNTYAPELTNAGVKYDEEPATQMAHNWGSGWVPGALAALYQDSLNLSS